MAKKNLKKPSVSLTRNGYTFTLSLNRNDNEADYFYIDRVVYEARDLTNGPNNDPEIKRTKIGAKSTSWSYKLGATKNHPNDGYTRYYPFANDRDSNGNPKQSDRNKQVEKVLFTVWTEGYHTYTVTTGKGKNKKTVKKKKLLKSKEVTKTYEFDNAVNPSVELSYDPNGTSFVFAIDINDDYSINSTKKKVATRAWAWLTSQVMGGKELKVPGYTGKWYNRDATPQIREKIADKISSSIPIKYTGHAYSAGPGGPSETKTFTHIFSVPNTPKAPRIRRSNALKSSAVDNGHGIYMVDLDIDTGPNGWHPVDNVTILYRDQDAYKGNSDIFPENPESWSVAKDNINSAIKQIQTDELGAVANDSVRYFCIKAEHDENVAYGYISGVVAYGKPSTLSGVSASVQSIESGQVINFSWTTPTSKLSGDPNVKLYNGGRLGTGGALRIKIYKQTTKNPIKTIYYGSTEWKNHSWTYHIPKSDIGKEIDYCFQVCVGLDNLDPGARSDDAWLYNIKVPKKCKNVKGNKQANNTTVEVTWENPTEIDTVYNGVEIAWSNMPNAWESNTAPSTAKFENGTMTKAYITGLSAGELYYFWVRLYETTPEGETNYGVWSDPSPGVLMSSKPDVPTLTLSRSWIKEGGTLSAQWAYYASGNLPQTNAQIEITKSGQSWGPIVNIDGEGDKCTIDLSKKINGNYLYPAGDYYVRVTVINELGEATSKQVELKIASNPTCSISSTSIIDYSYDTIVDETETIKTTTVKALRALPLTVNVAGDGDLNLYVYCSDEYSWEHPDRTDDIFQGDCVWTSSVEAGSYDISKILLADNARYRVQVECTDPNTLLTAEPQYIDFEVHWEHQAVAPSKSTVTINEDGTATLIPIKPEGALDTDVCDIYRSTADGRYLCCPNVSWGTKILDRLPTFGETNENSYCFCTRTTEGDEAWSDITYELDGSGIIISYNNKDLKLPWNVTNDDNRSKNGEIRSHLGGTKTYYGQPYIDRSQSLSTEVVKIDDEDLIEQLYELSRHTELCYIRTSNCIGYPAIVDVSISREYNNQIVSVSLSAKEADAENEFLGGILDEEVSTE